MRFSWVVIGMLACCQAHAQNGVWLSSVCNGAIKLRAEPYNMDVMFGAGACYGTVKAIKDYIIMESLNSGGSRESGLCPKRGTQIPDDEAIWEVNQYLQHNPGELQKSSTELTVKALRQAFPCGG